MIVFLTLIWNTADCPGASAGILSETYCAFDSVTGESGVHIPALSIPGVKFARIYDALYPDAGVMIAGVNPAAEK